MSNGIWRTVVIRCICKINQQTTKEETHIVDESDCTGKDQMPNRQLKIYFSFYGSSFSCPVHNMPYFVRVNKNTGYQVTLSASLPNCVIFLHTCMAFSTPKDLKTEARYLRKNG